MPQATTRRDLIAALPGLALLLSAAGTPSTEPDQAPAASSTSAAIGSAHGTRRTLVLHNDAGLHRPRR